MASHAQIEEWWDDYLCESAGLAKLTLNGRYPVRVQPLIVDATKALEQAIMSNGYRTPMDATGSYNCRQIGGTDTWSLHAYALAIDFDYPNNPYLRGETFPKGYVDIRVELTDAQVQAVEAIVNTHGEQMWRWLGRTIGDTMHFQINVPPDRTEVQWKDAYMNLERYATRWRNPQDFDAAAARGLITESEATYWKQVPTDNAEWQDLRDAIEVRKDLWPA